jgi:hypothetical protein
MRSPVLSRGFCLPASSGGCKRRFTKPVEPVVAARCLKRREGMWTRVLLATYRGSWFALSRALTYRESLNQAQRE